MTTMQDTPPPLRTVRPALDLSRAKSITIDPAVVSRDDLGMLQDLIMAAINDAHRRVDDALKNQMGSLLGGLGIPGM